MKNGRKPACNHSGSGRFKLVEHGHRDQLGACNAGPKSGTEKA
jgi:hypothetical protein